MNKIRFNIIKNRKVYYIISLAVIIVGIISVIFRGFNFDIDFTGGTSMTINMNQTLDQSLLKKVEEVAKTATGKAPSSVQKTGDKDNMVIIKTEELNTEDRDKLFKAVKDEFKLEATAPESTENVSATVGGDIRSRALIAVAIASLLMLIYISIRFELTSGIAAVLTLVHDVLIMLTAYTIFQIPMNVTFIAAVLTIIGYSINASIIVFDRVRENRKLNHKCDFAETAENSIWQTATRTINTTLTTLFTIVMVFIFGVTSVRNFALPLIIGIVTGIYSSLFLSSSLWVSLRKMKIGSKSSKLG